MYINKKAKQSSKSKLQMLRYLYEITLIIIPDHLQFAQLHDKLLYFYSLIRFSSELSLSYDRSIV